MFTKAQFFLQWFESRPDESIQALVFPVIITPARMPS
jgi:hypothetical protein